MRDRGCVLNEISFLYLIFRGIQTNLNKLVFNLTWLIICSHFNYLIRIRKLNYKKNIIVLLFTKLKKNSLTFKFFIIKKSTK